MTEFNTSLVREKIIFTDTEIGDDDTPIKEQVVIRSNRVFLRLENKYSTEKVVVRAQNMHATLRLAARILSEYYRSGLILERTTPLSWDTEWEAALSKYEKEYNKDVWAAVYINGKPVFKTVSSPFVDVIEQCALLTLDNYDATMEVTESALKKIGHAMRINHSSSVAAVLTDTGEQMRCGIVHRADSKDSTFSFTGTGGETQYRITQSFGIAAAYLEAFNLRFTIRMLQDKIRKNDLPKTSPESVHVRAAIARKGTISRAISSFEEIYNVRYRPVKPDLFTDT